MPARFFYDQRGSELFEEITALPEYYLTRKERSILDQYSEEIVAEAGSDLAIVEFGSGSSVKTRLLIDAALGRQSHLLYVPIDISRDFLKQSASDLMEDFGHLSVTALAGEYFDAIEALPRYKGSRLILFLGSNIGNFEQDEAVEFLSLVRAQMTPRDRILLGVDLAKDSRVIEPAYNDAAGVTAEFNLNILRRINRELGGQFEIDTFRHEAPFVPERSRIEMRLVSDRDQDVCVRGIGELVHFREGEYIHTENSHKFTEEALGQILSQSGLRLCNSWYDDERWFSLRLLESAG